MAVLIAFGLVALVGFLAATAVAHFLSKNGYVLVVACSVVGGSLFFGYSLRADSSGAPADVEYVRFVLNWVALLPALFGSVLGGLVGVFKRKRDPQ